MKQLLIILIVLPTLASSQNSGRYVIDKRVNGEGTVEEYGKPLWGYSYNHADTSNCGKLTAITEYKFNKRNGRRIQFFNYPNDTASVEHYTNDTLDGAYYYNHTNGKVWVRGEYDMGKNSVTPTYWSKNGELISENLTFNDKTKLYYLDGKLCQGKVTLYGHGGLDNMMPRDVIWFTKGKIDSVHTFRWAYWGMSAQLHRNYVDSTRMYIPYGPGEKPMCIDSFRIDTINFQFYKDGPDLFFRDLDRVTIHGWHVGYHLNSTVIKEEGRFVNGKQSGEWKFYDESGKLVKTVIY